jgi:hypothetical protein
MGGVWGRKSNSKNGFSKDNSAKFRRVLEPFQKFELLRKFERDPHPIPLLHLGGENN